jgi:hypothetical protein
MLFYTQKAQISRPGKILRLAVGFRLKPRTLKKWDVFILHTICTGKGRILTMLFLLKNISYWEAELRDGGDMGNPYTLLKGNNRAYHITNITAAGSDQAILDGLVEQLEKILSSNLEVPRCVWLALTNLGDLQNWKNSHVHVFAGQRNTPYWSMLDSLYTAEFKPRSINQQSYPAARVYGSRSFAFLPDFENSTPRFYAPLAEHALAIDITGRVKSANRFSHALLQAELKNIDAALQRKNHQQGSLVFWPADNAAAGWRLIYIVQENPVLLGAGAHSSISWLADFTRRLITRCSLPKPEDLKPARAAVVLGPAWGRQSDGGIVINDFGKSLAAEAVALYTAGKVQDIYFSGSKGERDVTKPPDANGEYPLITAKQLLYDYACAYFDLRNEDAAARAGFRKHIFLDPARAGSTLRQARDTLPQIAQDLCKGETDPLRRLAQEGGVILLDLSVHTPRTQQEFINAGYGELIQIEPVYAYNQALFGQARQLRFKLGVWGYIAYEQLLLRLGALAFLLKKLRHRFNLRAGAD